MAIDTTVCAKCTGTGICPWCGGSGRNSGLFGELPERCPFCHGSRRCKKCGGHGVIHTNVHPTRVRAGRTYEAPTPDPSEVHLLLRDIAAATARSIRWLVFTDPGRRTLMSVLLYAAVYRTIPMPWGRWALGVVLTPLPATRFLVARQPGNWRVWLWAMIGILSFGATSVMIALMGPPTAPLRRREAQLRGAAPASPSATAATPSA